MSQAIVDPEELRRFAAELKRFNEDLRDRSSSLMSRFGALGDSWQDQEQEKFAQEFVQTMKGLKRFNEVAERHAPYLMRKAERIQQYLDQR
ncbi:MAG: WXG100 family type VII secretion target [Verrucomicrobiota bacterium]